MTQWVDQFGVGVAWRPEVLWPQTDGVRSVPLVISPWKRVSHVVLSGCLFVKAAPVQSERPTASVGVRGAATSLSGLCPPL